MNQLLKLYGWTIGFLVALVIALNLIAALAGYVVWLLVLVGLVIVGRLVRWYTNY